MSISKWFVSDQKLFKVENSQTNSVFIVGTDFGFGDDEDDYSNNRELYWTDINYKQDRGNAGNAVHMWGNYLAGTNAADGGQRVLDRFSDISNYLNYFSVDMNLWDNEEAGVRPRGSHTYFTDFMSGSGHWEQIPHYDDPGINNAAEYDETYYSSHSNQTNDNTYWYTNTSNYGTITWHHNWLMRIKTGDPNLDDRMFGWYLMDEPFNSDKHRDYASNQYSVTGHYQRCDSVEGINTKPKMVNGFSNVISHFTNISGVLTGANIGGIYMGNDYDTNSADCWTTPNMVKWCKERIGTTNNEMVIAWIPGFASNLDMSYYFFYGSIIEGARGIIWWKDYEYSNYTHQSNVYNTFTSVRNSTKADEWVILSGTNTTNWSWDSNTNFEPSTGNSRYGRQISNEYSATVFKS